MNAKHTPGPWQANELTRPAISVEQRDPVRGTTIRTIARVSKAQNVNHAADAALIAAAPDLLAALKELVALDAEPNTFAKRGGSYWTNAIVNAMRAIAKATGEQQ